MAKLGRDRTVRADPQARTPVLVKFSPPVDNPPARRTADLLRCEHHALTLLRAAGVPAAASVVVEDGSRVYLEVERFDRVDGGRLGVVSLFALAAREGVDIRSWTVAADSLAALGVISQSDRARILLLDRVGALIGNTDRHAGNLSFFFAEGRVSGLAPVYDMLPMRYAPRGGEVFTPPLEIPTLTPTLPDAWRESWDIAGRFWGVVARDEAIAPELRAIASANVDSLRSSALRLEMLPGGDAGQASGSRTPRPSAAAAARS